MGHEQPRVLVAHAGEPVEVEMRDGAGRAVVGVTDDERRARDRARNAESAQRTAAARCDLPVPFGPTTTVNDGASCTVVGSPNDLNPDR